MLSRGVVVVIALLAVAVACGTRASAAVVGVPGFGHVFLVCATGKTAAEMLAILRDRLDHDAQVEIRIAAGVQAKITALRLRAYLPVGAT